jgi:uncharacterized protein YukE
MAGELNDVSEAIGKLRGKLDSLVDSFAREEISRRDIHISVNALESAQQEMAVTMTAIKESLEDIGETLKETSRTVASHEAFIQRAGGMRSFAFSMLGSGGIIGLIEAYRSWKG